MANTTNQKSTSKYNTLADKTALYSMHRVPVIKRRQLSPYPATTEGVQKKLVESKTSRRPLYLRYIEYT